MPQYANGGKTGFFFFVVVVPLPGKTICTSIDKNYSALLPVIYNWQSCQIAPIELESDNKEARSVNNAWFSMKAQIFSHKAMVINVSDLDGVGRDKTSEC